MAEPAEDDGALADEILAFSRAQLADIPDWTIADWQREQLEQELTIMASNKRRPTKRAPRTKTRNPQDTTLRNARAVSTRITYLGARIAGLEQRNALIRNLEVRIAKLEEVIAARVVGKP